MTHHPPTQPWFARVQHDLVKRLLWVARDCRDLDRKAEPGELVATVFDEEGQPIDALLLWERLREDAPSDLDLDGFEAALRVAVAAAQRNELSGVLALEAAFERLRAQGAEPTGRLAPSLNGRPS